MSLLQSIKIHPWLQGQTDLRQQVVGHRVSGKCLLTVLPVILACEARLNWSKVDTYLDLRQVG